MIIAVESLAVDVESAFRTKFGRDAEITAAAPGRVNLIGEHIDYNDGFVLPMAIERYIVVAAAVSADASSRHATIHGVDMDETIRISLDVKSTPAQTGWGKYIEGVVAGFANRGILIPPFDAVIASNVPQGGGLSSSAALEVATATMLEGLTGQTLTPIVKALLCQKAEHDFAGVPCGIMDQVSSVFGEAEHLMLIDCKTETCELVPFDASGISVLITNTNVKHELTGGEYASRRSDCDHALAKINKASWRSVTISDVDSARDEMSNDEYRRAKHVVSEIERTANAATSFREGNWDAVGAAMYASHDSLRDDFDVSCKELDVLVEIAREIGRDGGVIGSRMTGGGFGGCTVSLVENDSLSSVMETFNSQYKSRTGLSCSCFASRPARGAHVVEAAK